MAVCTVHYRQRITAQNRTGVARSTKFGVVASLATEHRLAKNRCPCAVYDSSGGWKWRRFIRGSPSLDAKNRKITPVYYCGVPSNLAPNKWKYICCYSQRITRTCYSDPNRSHFSMRESQREHFFKPGFQPILTVGIGITDFCYSLRITADLFPEEVTRF